MNKKEIQEFRKSFLVLEREIGQGSKETICCGITLAQCHSLLEIANSACCSLKNLAENFNLDKSTLSRTIDGIVALGLVKRRENPDDRRRLSLELTSRGRDIVTKINDLYDDYYSRLFLLIPEEQHRTVIEGITVLGKTLQNMRVKT